MVNIVLNTFRRFGSGLASGLSGLFSNTGVLLWDTLLTLLNTLSFSSRPGKLIPRNRVGHAGHWPAYVPPTDSDSRSCCPALNALSNHGILPHDGRNISFVEMGHKIREVYNFAPSFCYFVPKFSAQLLCRDYKTGTFNLSDLNVHNGIEHDGSLVRHDVFHQPDQGKPALDLIERLLACASGQMKGVEGEEGRLLTTKDLAEFSAIRRAESKNSNPQFTLSTFHKVFGSSNSSTMLTIYGGRIADLKPILIEERLPDGWESRVRKPWGLTMGTFNATVFGVEMRIREGGDVKVPTKNSNGVEDNGQVE